MLIKIQAVVATTVLMFSAGEMAAQDRPTPFGHTQGVSALIMVRDTFAQRNIAAVIRDEPGATSTPLIALKRSEITPALVYRALTTISEGRTKHNGPPSTRATTVLRSEANFESVPDEDQAWVADLVKQLSRARETNVPGVGRFPAVTLSIDKTALRAK